MGGLRASLIGSIVTATAALVLTLLLLEDPLIEYRETQRMQQELGEAARAALPVPDAALEGAVDRIASDRMAWIVVVDADDRVIADSAHAASSPPPDPELFAEARAHGEAMRLGPHPRRDEPWLSVAVTGAAGRVVRASRPATSIAAARATMRELLIVGGAICVLIALVLTIALSRTIVRPVQELTVRADALATGDLSVRKAGHPRGELGQLGRALDRMAQQLQEQLRTLRAGEARLRTVLDAMVEAVFVTDPAGRIVITNEALDRLVDGDVRGRTAMEATHSRELHEAVRDARKRGVATAVELTVEVGDDARVLAAHVAPLPDSDEPGVRPGVVAVLHDVTSLKQADLVRRDFVANASHELRTPLTAVRGFAETLIDGALTDPATATRFLSKIHQHTLRLQRIVDDLTLLSRAESIDDTADVAPVDVLAAARAVAGGLESHARAKRIQLSVEEADLPDAMVDERALDHVLVNLIDNAIKYTQDEGSVVVRASADDDAVVLEVADTGPGIAPAHQERIFERFYRVDAGRSREVGGTGLGLAIVKHLVMSMGGDIDVESKLGRGTTFILRLPRRAV